MKEGAVISRFAPSPTGRLHLGHAFSAIRAHDLARGAGGAFLLRIEDIDGTRSRSEHVAGIVEDLRWLGLEWDGEPLLQSSRLDGYAVVLDTLRERGLLYPCFCTRADIATSASAPQGPAEPIYPGTCRGLSDTERERRMDEPHAWRLDMAGALASLPDSISTAVVSSRRRGPSLGSRLRGNTTDGQDNDNSIAGLIWHDATAGIVAADPAAQGDVVLVRKDAPASYHLAVTVDDAWQGITDVVRGNDLFAATDVHRLLHALLGLPTPRYHHHPLLTDRTGRRLAKRDGAPSLADLRAGGADPAALVADLRAERLPVGFAAAEA